MTSPFFLKSCFQLHIVFCKVISVQAFWKTAKTLKVWQYLCSSQRQHCCFSLKSTDPSGLYQWLLCPVLGVPMECHHKSKGDCTLLLLQTLPGKILFERLRVKHCCSLSMRQPYPWVVLLLGPSSGLSARAGQTSRSGQVYVYPRQHFILVMVVTATEALSVIVAAALPWQQFGTMIKRLLGPAHLRQLCRYSQHSYIPFNKLCMPRSFPGYWGKPAWSGLVLTVNTPGLQTSMAWTICLLGTLPAMPSSPSQAHPSTVCRQVGCTNVLPSGQKRPAHAPLTPAQLTCSDCGTSAQMLSLQTWKWGSQIVTTELQLFLRWENLCWFWEMLHCELFSQLN